MHSYGGKMCIIIYIYHWRRKRVGGGGGGGGGGGARGVCAPPPLLTPHFYFPLELYVYITLTNNDLAFFIYQVIILWTISINWHRWLLLNNHTSKYNRRYINHVSVWPIYIYIYIYILSQKWPFLLNMDVWSELWGAKLRWLFEMLHFRGYS